MHRYKTELLQTAGGTVDKVLDSHEVLSSIFGITFAVSPHHFNHKCLYWNTDSEARGKQRFLGLYMISKVF